MDVCCEKSAEPDDNSHNVERPEKQQGSRGASGTRVVVVSEYKNG